MFLLVAAGVVILTASGWLVTRQRYVDDEVNRFVPGWSSTGHLEDVLEVAGAEPPVTVHVTQADDASPRG